MWRHEGACTKKRKEETSKTTEGMSAREACTKSRPSQTTRACRTQQSAEEQSHSQSPSPSRDPHDSICREHAWPVQLGCQCRPTTAARKTRALQHTQGGQEHIKCRKRRCQRSIRDTTYLSSNTGRLITTVQEGDSKRHARQRTCPDFCDSGRNRAHCDTLSALRVDDCIPRNLPLLRATAVTRKGEDANSKGVHGEALAGKRAGNGTVSVDRPLLILSSTCSLDRRERV
jgi:hypothetical protein